MVLSEKEIAHLFSLGFGRMPAPCLNKIINCIIVGIEKTGKSEFLHRLKKGEAEYPEYVATVGFNVQTIYRKDASFTFYDLGGDEDERQDWGDYTKSADAIIWVVDSSEERLG